MRKALVYTSSSFFGSLLTLVGVLIWTWLHQPVPIPPVPPINPDISVPNLVKAEAGRIVEIPCDTKGGLVRWYAATGPARPDLRELDKGHTLLFASPVVGCYTLLAWTSVNGTATDPVVCQVTVGSVSPPSPPDPPSPVDPVVRGFQAGYDRDTDSDKAKSLAFLASLYTAAATSIAQDQQNKTSADMLAALKAAVHAQGVGISDTAVTNLRRAIADYLNSVLDRTSTADADRAKWAAALAAVGKALGQVKQ